MKTIPSFASGLAFIIVAFMLHKDSLSQNVGTAVAIPFETNTRNADESMVDPLASELPALLQTSQMKMAKIYGAGGLKGLESYQSGFFVSDQGHILTSWSTVLDVDKIRVVTYEGKKWDGELIGSDPITELAVIKIEGDGFPFFQLDGEKKVEIGDRVFGVSNLFGIATGDEHNSIQHGVIMARSTLAARRGRIRTPYQGTIYVTDAMTNNPGATGGALVGLNGKLLGILGKELRDDSSGIWLNYAIPVDVVAVRMP